MNDAEKLIAEVASTHRLKYDDWAIRDADFYTCECGLKTPPGDGIHTAYMRSGGIPTSPLRSSRHSEDSGRRPPFALSQSCPSMSLCRIDVGCPAGAGCSHECHVCPLWSFTPP